MRSPAPFFEPLARGKVTRTMSRTRGLMRVIFGAFSKNIVRFETRCREHVAQIPGKLMQNSFFSLGCLSTPCEWWLRASTCDGDVELLRVLISREIFGMCFCTGFAWNVFVFLWQDRWRFFAYVATRDVSAQPVALSFAAAH